MNHKQTPEYYNFTSKTYNSDLWNDYFDCMLNVQNKTKLNPVEGYVEI